jgi:hypothetical protein
MVNHSSDERQETKEPFDLTFTNDKRKTFTLSSRSHKKVKDQLIQLICDCIVNASKLPATKCRS